MKFEIPNREKYECPALKELINKYCRGQAVSSVQKTFVIIKPDAIERGLIGKIISRFEDKFLRISHIEMRWKTEEWCKQHYQHLTNTIISKLSNFMTAAPIIGIIVTGPDAVVAVRKIVGKTDSREADPGTIRGDYGTYPIHYNIVHAADCESAAEREVLLFFDRTTDKVSSDE